MTPDTKVQSETLEEIANRIAGDWFPERGRSTTRMALSNDILSALRNERQRAVGIAKGEDCGLADCLCANRIASAIREGR